jgi:hypothetical protein
VRLRLADGYKSMKWMCELEHFGDQVARCV